MAQRRRIDRHVIADPADHDLPRVEPEPHLQVDVVRLTQLVRVLTDRLRQMPGGVAGPPGVVLLRDRSPEQRHDPVPGELVHRPPELADAFGQNRHEPAHDGRPHFGVEALLQVHRAGHVGEQDGDVFLLARAGDRRQ